MVRSTLKLGVLVLAVIATGCGGSDRPKMAETVGVVTFKGNPLPKANVVFMPASGPAAYGSTDANGAFTLSTQGDPGAMVGSGTFVITAYDELPEPKPEHLLTAADLKKMNTSLIPTKYGKPDTSGLQETIKPDVKNEFKFDLK